MASTQTQALQADIPIVDLQAPDAPHALLDAACDHGFIFIKHKGLLLSPNDVAEMFDLSYKFFSAPESVKAEATINSGKAGKNLGWLPMNKETLDPAKQKQGDFKQAFNIGLFDADGKPRQPLPGPFEGCHSQIREFMDRCHELCKQILTLLAVALEIQKEHGGVNWFSDRHDKDQNANSSVMRLLYYPTLSPSAVVDRANDIRAGAHSDYGSVTLLFRLPFQPGLEILTKGGDWATVPVDPNPASGDGVLPILVNIGDALSYWTNGLLKSTVHRVVFPGTSDPSAKPEDRYSMAYFCHPDDDVPLVQVPSAKVPSLVNESRHQPVLTAKGHLNNRLAATYGIKA